MCMQYGMEIRVRHIRYLVYFCMLFVFFFNFYLQRKLSGQGEIYKEIKQNKFGTDIQDQHLKPQQRYARNRKQNRRKQLETMKTNISLKLEQIQKDRDIFRLGPFKALENYRNPCFNYKTTIRCLPYLFIVGMPKCATTDLWKDLVMSDGTALQHQKEPKYFNKFRFSSWTFEDYLNHYKKSVDKILNSPEKIETGGTHNYFNLITGDGSVDTAHDNNHWRELPENNGCTEPCFINAHYIHHLNPNIKIIFLLRNPLDRLHSDYIYESRIFGLMTSVQGFHDSVLKARENFMKCIDHLTLRGCAYNSSNEKIVARLRVGLYHIFLEDWYEVFPASQIMVINFDDYTNNRLKITKKVYKFLGLRDNLTAIEEHQIARRPIANKEKGRRPRKSMFNSTRNMLIEFYKPFNERLAKLLGENKYLHWNN